MAYEVWTDPAFQREFDELTKAEQDTILEGIRGLAGHPIEHPQVRRLKGTKYPGSFRLRVGRYRVVGIVLELPKLILLTTVFLKKRDSDYGHAAERHEVRLRAQGPPLDEYVKAARRRR